MCGLRRERGPDVTVRTRPYRQRRRIASLRTPSSIPGRSSQLPDWLPSSLLIENAWDRDLRSTPKVCSEAFPIKASDDTDGTTMGRENLMYVRLEIKGASPVHAQTALNFS